MERKPITQPRDDKILNKIWAKTDRNDPTRYHPLLFHMLDVAAVCGVLYPQFGIESIPIHSTMFLAALHDIGKADAWFQGKAPVLADRLREAGFQMGGTEDEIQSFRHEARSAEWIWGYLAEKRVPKAVIRIIAAAIRGHHGNFGSTCVTDTESQAYQYWCSQRDHLASRLEAIIQPEDWNPERFENASQVGIRLTGLIVLSDWIASNEELYHYWELQAHEPPECYWQFAREEAQRAVQRLQFDRQLVVPPADEPLRFQDVWTPEVLPELKSLNPVQQALEQVCLNGVEPGLAIIEAPMGQGKTEAALYLAEYWNRRMGRCGTYIALPTMATSNQMYDRYRHFLSKTRPEGSMPRLIHGMAWLLDEVIPTNPPQTDGESEGDGQQALEWFYNTKRALLATEGVGTVDQALMAALNVKHGFLRLFGLSNKVLIIDEVHAYDEYMTTIMEVLLAWCRALKIPVILLSATLSQAQKRRLVKAYTGQEVPSDACLSAYPLLTFAPWGSTPYTVPVEGSEDERVIDLKIHPGLMQNAEETASLAVSLIQNGGCACVITNTVNQAQAVYLQLKSRISEDTDLFLFHARYRAERRQPIEQGVVQRFGKSAGDSRPQKAILVATQVVEQSLDVDFDVMISEIAPIDLLLQRAGRLHRHPRGERPTGPHPVLHVLLPPEGEFTFGATGYVYSPYLLLRTLALLQQKEAFFLPADFRHLIESCYGEDHLSYVPQERMEQAKAKREALLHQMAEKAAIHLIPLPDKERFALADSHHRPVEEAAEGERADYFHAQTRYGEDTSTVLILHDSELAAIARSLDRPPKRLLKQLFLQKAGVPSWWLRDVEASEESFFEGLRWLRGHKVLVMRNGMWSARDHEGKTIVIRDDPVIGVILDKE